MAIEYVPYQHIDKEKWDACIAAAGNGLIYATSIYLDSMAENWDALVLDNYETVMPLTWGKKYNIHYLYQPFFTASLGVFGKKIDAALLNDFLQAIPAKFKYWDIYLNNGNYFQLENFKLYERMNYILPLNEQYEKLSEQFRDNIKRNIRKSEKLNCLVQKDIPVDEVIALATEQSQAFSSLSKDDFDRFKKLYQQLHQQQRAVTYGVYTSSGQLVASGVFFFYLQRAYYILVGNHPNSKAVGASHALINAFIKDHAGNAIVLDFEGSDISSLAFFYSSFGASEEKYVGLKLNRLPALVKLFKK
ncbi:MAG: hypothetical protein IPP72_08345 [Chitinophagaceae bacterium]|nr:hypothetical protein [Chitinophagaceae bacterium]